MSGLLDAARRDWRKGTGCGRLCYPWEAIEWVFFRAFWGFMVLAEFYAKALNGDVGDDDDGPSKYKESDEA